MQHYQFWSSLMAERALKKKGENYTTLDLHIYFESEAQWLEKLP